MKIGDVQVDFPLDGYFKLDGGAMFGIIPKPLWEQRCPSDDRNRIQLAARPMLLRTDRRTVLVDTGIGGKWDEKERSIYDINRDVGGIRSSLQERGVQPEEVTDVVLTHLHFDHTGATTYRDGDQLRLAFPEATHHVQRANWKWAQQPTERDAGSFRSDDFSPLDGSDQLRLLDGDEELFPGVHVRRVDGHTKGLQMIRVTGPSKELLYVTDLIPTSAHLPLPYVMGYDLWPLETLEEKKKIYRERSSEKQTLIAFEHDPDITVCSLRDGEKHPEVDQVVI